MKIVFASQNPHKIEEVRKKLGNWQIEGLSPELFPEELKEEGETLEENALSKVRQVYARCQCHCFADDTGLEVASLNQEPGVRSARYAGEEKNDEANIDLLLKNLEGYKDRRARFRTVIALIWEDHEYIFEGQCEGYIIHERRGSGGFGYDAVFVPEGYELSFAQMSLKEKNKISHRGKAIEVLRNFLEKL